MCEGKPNSFIGEFQNKLANDLSKKLSMPVYVDSQEFIDTLFEKANHIPDIYKKYTEAELREEISYFISKTMAMSSYDEAEAEKRIKIFFESLGKKKNYVAFIIFTNVLGLPVGAKIGPLEVVEQKIEDAIPSDFLKYQIENNNVRIDGRTQARLSFSAYTSTKVLNVLDEMLELPLSIISLILNIDIDMRACIGSIKSTDISTVFLLQPQGESRGWASYRGSIYGDQFERLSKISTSKKPTQLQNKILQAIQNSGLSRHSHKAEVKFLVLIASFESLLLSKNDKDYLGKKLSEKTAFLLEDNYEKRLKLYTQMKRFYKKRSDLVHNGKTQLTDSEVAHLKSIFKAVVYKLLELSMTYPTMERKNNSNSQDGIEDYINRLKFT